MAITRQEIEHIAVLARLEMSGERFDHLAGDMQNIVGMVDKLQQRVARGRRRAGVHA